MSPKKTMVTLKMNEVDWKDQGNIKPLLPQISFNFKLQETALLKVTEEWTPTATPITPKERYQTEMRPKNKDLIEPDMRKNPTQEWAEGVELH